MRWDNLILSCKNFCFKSGWFELFFLKSIAKFVMFILCSKLFLFFVGLGTLFSIRCLILQKRVNEEGGVGPQEMLKYLLIKDIIDELTNQYDKTGRNNNFKIITPSACKAEIRMLAFLLKKLPLLTKPFAPMAQSDKKSALILKPWSSAHKYISKEEGKEAFLTHQTTFQRTFRVSKKRSRQVALNLYALVGQQITQDPAGKVGRDFCMKLIGALNMFFGDDRDTEYAYLAALVNNAARIYYLKNHASALAWLWKALHKHKFF